MCVPFKEFSSKFIPFTSQINAHSNIKTATIKILQYLFSTICIISIIPILPLFIYCRLNQIYN